MTDQLKPETETDFATDFREGEAMCREWIAGRGELPDLLHIVRDMPRGADIGGLEAGFLSALDAAVRGDWRGAAGAPTKGQPSPDASDALSFGSAALPREAPLPEVQASPAIDVDEFYLQRHEHAQRARLKELWAHNDAIWKEQQPSVFARNSMGKDANWRGG